METDTTVKIKGFKAWKKAYSLKKSRSARILLILKTLIYDPFMFPAFIFHEACHLLVMLLFRIGTKEHKLTFYEMTGSEVYDIETKQQTLANTHFVIYGLNITLSEKRSTPLRVLLIALAPAIGHILLVVLTTVMFAVTDDIVYFYAICYCGSAMPMFMLSDTDTSTAYINIQEIKKRRANGARSSSHKEGTQTAPLSDESA